jgi:hypothetical protein
MEIVLDTNILISSLLRNGLTRDIISVSKPDISERPTRAPAPGPDGSPTSMANSPRSSWRKGYW